MTTHICEGFCNRAWRQAHTTHEAATTAWQTALNDWETADTATRGDRPAPPEAPTLTPTPGEPVWCRRCSGAIRTALADLDNLAALLAATSDGHRGQASDTDKIRATKTTPSPSPAADTLDHLYGDLAAVETNWREARGYGPRPTRTRGASALTTVIAWLSRHLDDILTHPGSIDFGTRVLRWQRVLQHQTKTQPERRRKAAPCPRCDQRTLIHETDRDVVRCENPNCGRVMNTDEYDAHLTTQENRIAS